MRKEHWCWDCSSQHCTPAWEIWLASIPAAAASGNAYWGRWEAGRGQNLAGEGQSRGWDSRGHHLLRIGLVQTWGLTLAARCPYPGGRRWTFPSPKVPPRAAMAPIGCRGSCFGIIGLGCVTPQQVADHGLLLMPLISMCSETLSKY